MEEDGIIISKHCPVKLQTKIDWKDIIPFAFVTPIGKWHERGKMGWWACVSNEKATDNWKSEFKEFLDNLDEDTIVTVVDCHI